MAKLDQAAALAKRTQAGPQTRLAIRAVEFVHEITPLGVDGAGAPLGSPSQLFAQGYVVEVPGAGALNPERHMYEEVYLVVEGRGTTGKLLLKVVA